MMQVDLPMPEACDVCPFNYDFCWCKAFKDDEFDQYSDDWNKNVCERTTRPEYCPLKEIVRCKDCRKNMMCEITLNKPPDWFCADGKRKY